MLLPGFGTHPVRMKPLAAALESAGHRVSDWGLGFNFGSSEPFRALGRARGNMARREAALVLVGWSLGGLFARQLAKTAPDHAALVITMGTPFSGDRRANNAWRAYQIVAGHSVDEAPMAQDLATKPPVPTIALWSPRDGIVNPRSAAGWRASVIWPYLRVTHLGFAAHPQVATLVDLVARH
jgi:pimeloyl-ACP methyl ester carboxylesterase